MEAASNQATSLDIESQLPWEAWTRSSWILATTVLAVLTYTFYYLKWVVSKPQVIGATSCKGTLKNKIVESCPIFSERYWPTFWAFQYHLNTIARFVLQRSPNTTYKRDVLTLNDGGEVALDWGQSVTPNNMNNDIPVLLIVPGITGHSRDNYVKHLVHDGLVEGYRPVVFNQRGTGIKLKTLRTYCTTDMSDLFEVLHFIHMQYPKAAVIALGVSLGGMILIQYLHQLGKECDLEAVISISAAWDPFKTVDSLEKKWHNRLLYSKHVAKNLRKMFISNSDLIVGKKLPFNVDAASKIRVVSEFDIHVTVPLFGFSSLDEYYRASCNSDKIHKIQTPLICINATDDPFVPKESLPFEEIESNPHTVMVVTSHGGHIGFIEGVYPHHKTWMNRAVKQLLAALKE